MFNVRAVPAVVLILGHATILSVAEEPRATISLEGLGTLFDEALRIEHFRHIERVFPVKHVQRSETTFNFRKNPVELTGVKFQWRGEIQTLDQFLEKTITTNFLVIKDDAIVNERYFLGNDKDSLSTSMSVAKSFTSALVGIALAEGLIESIDDPVTKYVPELAESGYRDVPIRHILQMSSGIDFSEIYDDQTSDIIIMMGQVGSGMSVKDYAAKLTSADKSGETFNYASIDTNVLGMLLENVTGKDPAAYLEEKIWRPLGMESDATWGTDNHGNVLTFAWLNVAARDYAKFGRLYLNRGNWNGEQIVPAEWVEASIRPDKEYLKLRDHYTPGWDIGYQYQWWVPAGDEGEFTGIGVWGQYLYVNPAKQLIIVKNSVDPDFDTRDMETIVAFRAVGEHLSEK